MHIFKLSAITLLTLSLIGCSKPMVKTVGSVTQGESFSESDIDLMIQKAKAAERDRVQAEYEQQKLTASIFANLKKMNLPALAGNCLARVVVPAQTSSSYSVVEISKERLSYRTVVCQEHFTMENIIKLQASLRDNGFLKSEEVSAIGLLNGNWDERTALALVSYQKANRLAYGDERVEWTLESLRHLNLL